MSKLQERLLIVMMKRTFRKQIVAHLLITQNLASPKNLLKVNYSETIVSFLPQPPAGYSYIQPWYSAPCGTDGSSRGYYHGGRFFLDLQDKEKLEENLRLLKESGIVSEKRIREKLLRIPNHEGWGKVVSTSPNPKEKKREIAAFLPTLSLNKKEIIGLKYARIFVDFQDLKKDDWVVINAALRCDKHWQINPQTGFPDSCHRETKDGHQRKRVPGHYEIYGTSHFSKYGLPYSNHMLTKVPDALKSWIKEKPNLREKLLIMTEPFSCCFEAFHPIIIEIAQNREHPPERISILGDGMNAALLVLLATTIFPHAELFVKGGTVSKLQAIKRINPEKIHTIIVDKSERHKHGYSQLRGLLGEKKLDLVIPTFSVDSLRHYAPLTKKSGRVIVWAADQVHDQKSKSAFLGVGDPEKIHYSYGGWNQAEWTALNFFETLSRLYPKRLEAICQYPVQYFDMKKGAEAMDIWLANNGKYLVEMNSHKTSGKIIIDHRK